MSELPSLLNQLRQFFKNKSTISGNKIEGNNNIQGNDNNNKIQGSNNIQGNNNNVDKSDVKVDVTVNLVKNKSLEKTSDGCQEEDEEYEISFIISGTAKRKDKTTLKAIEKHLNKILNAASLTISDIDEGSLKLFFNGTKEDLEKLENSFKSGELKDIFDIPIEDVNFVENNKQKLAVTIAGNVSYTDIAKLKSALTGVDQKEILVQKIRSNRGDLKILNLARADLRGADLRGADLRRANLRLTNLCLANLHRANLSGADLQETDLSYADLSYADLSYADLTYADLSYANLSYADLTYADLTYANLSYADFRGAELKVANLREANLREANLSGANLSEANLIGTNLIGTNLSGTNLSGANLSGANLIGANLSEANVSEANLGEANLSGADLRGTDLRGTDFKKSTVVNARFSSSNSLGMTRELKQELIKKGAIFEDSLEDPLTLSPLRD